MICPICSEKLTEVTVAGIPVDLCDNGCGGIWFDWFELNEFDEQHEITDEQLIDILTDTPVNNPKVNQGESHCPRCSDIIMSEHIWRLKKEIRVDECPQCGGFWIDAGELIKIRELYEAEQKRHQAGGDEFRKIYLEQLTEMKDDEKAKLEAALSVSEMHKYLCQSCFTDSSEDWGVF